ncbi:MAG TPA: hypothetical protein VJ724_01510 [Tahibacter sp.]|nr:hypothetical protein [Tahibacter sp.]
MHRSIFIAKSTTQTIAFAAALAAAPAFAASVEPASPAPFERVHLVTAFSACTTDPQTAQVTLSGDTIRVVLEPQIAAICAPNPPAEPYEIQLGAFPVGSYKVEVTRKGAEVPVERTAFDVLPLAQVAQFPAPFRPIADYSGQWWTPSESGWGLSLAQSSLGGVLFGALYVFDANRQPHWYTLQDGTWLGTTSWRGKVIETHGPAWSAPVYDTGSVASQVVGEATLEFRRVAAAPGTAVLTYTIGNTTVTKTIAKIRF